MNILNISKKKLNFSCFIREISKAYTEGVYCDSPANRKLGRVGMTYAAYAQKMKSNKEEKENKSSEKESSTKQEKIFKEGHLEFIDSPTEQFKKEIKEAKENNKNIEEFKKEALYLTDIHSSNFKFYGFLNSINNYIKENKVENYFKIEGSHGTYKIVTTTGKELFEISISTKGKQILFKKSNEDKVHTIKNNYSTINTYFKQICDKIKEEYPKTKKELDSNNSENEAIKKSFEIINFKGQNIVKDKESGILLGNVSYLNVIGNNRLSSLNKNEISIQKNTAERIKDRAKFFKKVVEKYNLKPIIENISENNSRILYPIGSYKVSNKTRYVNYYPLEGILKWSDSDGKSDYKSILGDVTKDNIFKQALKNK